MGGKLFSSYRTAFELAQGLQDSKTSDLNCSYEALVQKEALTVFQDRVFASFLCVLSLSSVLPRFIYLHCDTGSLGRSTPAWGANPLLLPHSHYICYKHVIKDRGKITSLAVFYKLFLSDTRVEILINSWHFSWMCPLPDATPSVFSKRNVLKWYTYRGSFSDIRSVVLEF